MIDKWLSGYPMGWLDSEQRWHFEYLSCNEHGGVWARYIVSEPYWDSDYIYEVFEKEHTIAWMPIPKGITREQLKYK